ncbi:MAG TPA: fluoride efflux transporter CrcB, partial [Roseomonas sp.]
MGTYLWIALGGALGSVARAWGSVLAVRLAGAGFPWGTIAINVLGSFVIGVFAALTAPGGRIGAQPDLRAFVMVGICGGFTTFSSFSLQTLELLQQGRTFPAMANVALSVVLCLGAVAIGHALASAMS